MIFSALLRLAIFLAEIFTAVYPGHLASAAKPFAAGPTDPGEVQAFVDPLVMDLMSKYHVPGGAVILVKDGEILYANGYGYADLERKISASAEKTVFRVGSISKLFTWTAVMQLVEQGKLDLNQDVNLYLSDFQIPATFAEPITLSHLMTHTAGFEDDIVNGAVFVSEAEYQPLDEFLSRKMPARIFPPGQVVAYSNYGAALAGEIVSEVSGEPFEQYIQNQILRPLAMHHSSFLQPLPEELARDAAVGYDRDGEGNPRPNPFEFIQLLPAGALSATAKDIGHFMIAHLQDGRYGQGRILKPESAQNMRRQHYVFHPSLPGTTLGFAEAHRNNISMVFHPGTTDLSASLMALLPEQHVGIFMTFNSYISTSTRLNLLSTLLDHYYPGSEPQETYPHTDFSERATSFTGSYLSTQRAETNWGKLAASLMNRVFVVANSDGTLTVDAFKGNDGNPKRWVEISPLLFQEVNGQSLLAFQVNAWGQITAMAYGDQPVVAFQKLTWYQDPNNQVVALGLALVFLLGTIVAWLLGALLRLVRRSAKLSSLERRARFLAACVILLILIIVGLIISVLAGDESMIQFGYPSALTIAGVLGFIVGVGIIACLFCAIILWKQPARDLMSGLHYTLVVTAALYFVWYLNEVNLLVIPF